MTSIYELEDELAISLIELVFLLSTPMQAIGQGDGGQRRAAGFLLLRRRDGLERHQRSVCQPVHSPGRRGRGRQQR